MLKGAKTWEEMRAELPLGVQQRLDERATENAKLRGKKKRASDTETSRNAKPAA